MKIKITLLLSVFFALSLSAQQQRTAIDKGLSFEMPAIAKKGSMVIDTMRPYPAGCDTSLALYGITDTGGYVTGTNPYGDLEKAQLFPDADSGNVTAVMVLFGAKKVVGSPDDISAKIYSGTTAGGPSAMEGTSDPVSMTNVDTTGFTTFNFATPVSYSDPFFVSVEVSATDDTVGIVHTGFGCTSNAWEMWSDNSWNNMASTWNNFDVALMIWAVVDEPSTVSLNENFISATGLNIFPNPADKEITVRFEEALTEDANIVMKSVEGKSASATSISLDPGNRDYNIPVESLSPGAYVLEAQSGDRFYRKVFIKK